MEDTLRLFHPADKAKFSGFHLKSMVSTGMGVFTDGYDLSSIGIVLPLALAAFGVKSLTGLESSLLAGAALVGAALGAILFGILANRGRKAFYGLDVTMMALDRRVAPRLSWMPKLAPTPSSRRANRGAGSASPGFGPRPPHGASLPRPRPGRLPVRGLPRNGHRCCRG